MEYRDKAHAQEVYDQQRYNSRHDKNFWNPDLEGEAKEVILNSTYFDPFNTVSWSNLLGLNISGGDAQPITTSSFTSPVTTDDGSVTVDYRTINDAIDDDDYSDLGFSDNLDASVFMEEGGQISQGLDNLYMNRRDSKQKLDGMIGIQSRQYGGGLDDAYMNRRSAFAAPDANSAFASPMGQSGLPTIYRQEGGDIPITSVNGQGIRRIIYRENGGSFMDDADAQAYADVYGPADPGNVDPDEGSYDSVTGMPSVTTPQGTPPPTNDGMGDAGIPLSPLNNFMINLQIKNQKAAQEKQAGNQQYIQNTTKAANMANVMPGIPAVSNAAMVALQSQTPNTPQRGGVEDPETSLSQDKVSSDKSVSDLTTTEFNSLVGTLSDKMNNSQASKFSSSISNNDKVSDVVGKANDVFFNSPATNNKGFPNDSLTSYNRKSGGGLPTIYRESGGGMGYEGAEQAYLDMAAEEEASYGDGLGDVGGGGGLPGGSPAPAPAAPQGGTVGSDVDFNTSSFPTNPNAGVFGTPLQTFAQIKGRLDGDGPDDGYTQVESTYLNDIMSKTGMTITEAENYLASMMATPGGIAAMNQGFHGGYTGGGPAGTLDNFARGVSDNLGIQEIFNKDKKNKKEEDLLRDQAQGVEPSILNSIQNTVTRLLKGNKGLETEEGKQEFKNTLEREGFTYEPPVKNMTQTAFGIANSALNPLSGIAGILEFLTGATPMGTVISKEGVRFALDTTGTLTPEAFLMNAEVDYGNEATPKRGRRPVQQKTASTTEDKPLTAMEALLAKRDKPVSIEASNKYNDELYKKLYENINVG